MRLVVGLLYSILAVASGLLVFNMANLAGRLSATLGGEELDWGFTREALRWYAAGMAAAAVAVAGLGFDFPPLTLLGLAALVPTVIAAWVLGFVKRVRRREMFSLPGRIGEMVAWVVVGVLLAGGFALAKPG